MNDYREVRFTIAPMSEAAGDILAAMLADEGYESFVPDEQGVTAYVPAAAYDATAVADIIPAFPMEGVKIDFTDTFVEGRDWNSEWERNYFQPIVVGDEVVIHSSFHHDIPKARYDIVIDPKMAFGTGHHATTSLILRELLKMPLEGRSMMDMGTGTGILALLAAMRGATPVEAIEIDEFAYTNALENVALNGHPEIKISLGDASLLPDEPRYDLFVANINRNVITADMARYAASLRQGGTMLLSGFYQEDIPIVAAESERHGLTVDYHNVLNNWTCLRLTKIL